MLRGAVEAVGGRADDVRLVRVFAGDATVSGARKVGDYQFVVDLHPRSMKQVAAPAKERGGRGGGGGGRGEGAAAGSGPRRRRRDRGAKGSTTGGFSMDSLRDDRKNIPSRRPGGGRRPAGGGPGRGGPKR